MKRLFRWLVWFILFSLLIAICLGIFGWFQLSTIIKKSANVYGTQMTGTQVIVGGVGISPLTGELELRNVSVGMPSGFKSPSTLTVDKIFTSIDIMSVLQDTLVINQVRVERPKLTLEYRPKVGYNIKKIYQNVDAYMSKQPKQANSTSKKFLIHDLHVQAASLNVVAPFIKTPVLRNFDYHQRNIGNQQGGVTATQAAQKAIAGLLEKVMAESKAANLKQPLNIAKEKLKAMKDEEIKKLEGKVQKELDRGTNKVNEKLQNLFQ